MQTNEAVSAQNIQQAVIEKLALLSLEKQKQVLALAEELTQTESNGQSLWEMAQACLKDVPPPKASKFRAMFEEAARDVPPEAWDEVPADASSNIDRYLYRNLGK